MTDNEIVKALEICANEETDLCTDCPCLVDDCCTGYHYRENFVTMVLDLINRQKAELDGQDVEIMRLKHEIERLQQLQKPTGAGGFKVENGKVVYYSDMLNGYRHEYKDLDEIVKELNLYMHTDYKNIELISHYKGKLQTTKAEAIKEFAGRLKEKKTNIEVMRMPFLNRDIDNLVKEMVGDNDV